MSVSFRSVGGVSQPVRVYRVTEHFKDSPMSRNECYRVPLVGIHPNIPKHIEGDAVAAFENRMSDEDIAKAEGVGCKCGITPRRTLEISIKIEFYLPQCSASGIDIEEITLPIKG